MVSRPAEQSWLMPMIRLSGWQECQDSIAGKLAATEPVLIGRIGGSDTDALAALLDGRFTDEATGLQAALSHLWRVKQFNGYYDRAGNPGNYFGFLALLQESYRQCGCMAFVDSKLLTLYFPDNLNPIYRLANVQYERAFRALVAMVEANNKDAIAYPYTFFQTLTGPLNLFRVFEKSLRGKRVLIASPFGASISANWHNRRQFLKDYDYPEFEPIILNTPITYDGLPAAMYPHNNWFETLQVLKDEMGKTSFDVALLSCGSYAMPLGLHARDVLGRKAIYVGGILQLLFGIMGRRYENPFFLDGINRSAYITPVERETFLKHISLGSNSPMEAFGAYF